MLNLQQPRATSVQAPIVKINKEYTDITGKDNKEGFSNVQQADSSGEHGLGKDHTESLHAGTAEDGFSNVNLSLPDDQQIDSSLESQTGWSAVSLLELASEITVMKEGIMEFTSSVDGGGSFSVASGSDLWVTETNTESPYSAASFLLGNRVLVRRRKSDLMLPKNATDAY